MERIERVRDFPHSPRPSRGERVWLALLVSLIVLLGILYLRFAWRAGQRLDVLHAAFFDSCTNHVYQAHWQNTRRYPSDMRGDFIVSTRSFVLIEIWIAGWPSLRYSRVIPGVCV